MRRLALLLSIWFLGSYGTSILFVDQLDALTLFGFPLGFWFAQQGSIYLFLLLVIVYIRTMNALDDEYEKAEAAIGAENQAGTQADEKDPESDQIRGGKA